MVKETEINITQNPTWGGVIFNHTIILIEEESTRFLDFLVV